jgi:hypothetical protein
MAIALSHGGPTIYRSSTPSDRIFVGTIKGVVCIQRDSPQSDWRVAFTALTDRHIHAVAIEPETGAILAGANRGSIFASEDGGRTWDRRDAGLTEQDVYGLAIGRSNLGPRIYAGTEPAHVFYSDDLGKHWSDLPALRRVDMSRWVFPDPPHIAHTKHISVHPRDPNILYVCVEQGGLLKTVDGGQSFQVVPGMDDDLHRTVIDPLDPEHVIIVTGVGIYETRNGGNSITQLTGSDHEIGGYPDLMVMHPQNPAHLFVAAARNTPDFWVKERHAHSRMCESMDGGKNWKTVPGIPVPLRTAFEAICLEDWGSSFAVLAATATGEIWSHVGGQHWRQVIENLAPISKGIHHESFALA